MRVPAALLALIPLAAAGETTPVGLVGSAIDLRPALPNAVAAALPIEPTVHTRRIPIGKDKSGEAELAWSTAEVAGGAWVTEVRLSVVRASEGYEVLEPVVIPPLNRGTDASPLATVGVIVGWRKDSACRSEMASETVQVDGKGVFTEL